MALIEFEDLPSTDTAISADNLNHNFNDANRTLYANDFKSKNLFDTLWKTDTINGITFKNNGDGTITANGTATANAFYSITKTLPAGTYTLSGSPSGAAENKYLIQATGYGTGDTGTGQTFTLSQETDVTFRLMVWSGQNVSNILFKPQLEVGTAITTFVQGMKVVEIKDNNVKEDATFYANDFKCRNLFSASEINLQSFYICPCKIGDTFSISFKGYATSSDKRVLIRTTTGAYSPSVDTYTDVKQIILTSENASYSTTITSTINGYLYFRLTAGVAPYTLTNIQVEKGEATPYTPYIPIGEEIYSLSEELIGRWIDGKPLYRKVIDLGYMPNNTEKTVAHNISNISTFVSVRAIAQTAGPVSLTLPNYNGSIYSNIYANATNVIIQTNGDRSSFTGYAILEYTKTTN